MTLANAAEMSLADAPFTWRTLQAISSTEFVPAGLRGKPEAILACILTGRELGLGPMESLRMIDMIDGKPSPSSEWMLARVFDAGHVIYPEVQTAEACTIVAKRMNGDQVLAEVRFTFTIEMAKRAGLAGKNNWKSYPEAMLYWRAVAQVCRQLFPDLLHGMKYLPEELGSEEWVATPPQTPALAVVSDAEEAVPAEIIEQLEADPLIIDTDETPATEDDVAWSDLYALLAEEPTPAETMKALEGRLRSLYELMGRLLIWPILTEGTDPLHRALSKYAHVAHVGDLKKDKLVAFCKLSWSKAREAVEKIEKAS